MKQFLYIFIATFAIIACENPKEISSFDPVKWEKRTIDISQKDSLEVGKTYLSIYSQIYSVSEHKTHNLTAMVSLRNTSPSDTIYLLKADYHDTKGHLIRTYFDKTIYLSPLETIEIVIEEVDVEGGTGSNFIFDWKIPKSASEPLFEGIMNSTTGQQGISFVTDGIRIE
ncbi:MAG: DUF3124 domain-containing protein [Flavobacteriaceae bacterium]|nr:DUF3124 domain-containing protein [Flavobacteriaceae bacterium]